MAPQKDLCVLLNSYLLHGMNECTVLLYLDNLQYHITVNIHLVACLFSSSAASLTFALVRLSYLLMLSANISPPDLC